MYELLDYLAMIEDPVRTPAFLAAMRSTIRPGDRVLELGTGFGYFAVQACHLGASHVTAIEPSDAIALGPALAAANGCADRITFVQDHSERVTLPRRADVLLEDLRGISPLHRGRIGAIADARRRHLVPGARQVGALDHLYCAPCEWPADLGVHPADATARIEGVDVGGVRAAAGGSLRRSRFASEELLATGAPWATLDLRSADGPHASGECLFDVEREGRLAAIACWFSAELAAGIVVDTGPSHPRTIYGRMVLPLAEPRRVAAGERLRIALRATHDGADYVWAWEVEAAGWRTTGSTLASHLLSARRRARRAASFVPEPTPALDAVRDLLTRVDGRTTLGAIAAAVRAAHPALLTDDASSLRWSGDRLAALTDPGEA